MPRENFQRLVTCTSGGICRALRVELRRAAPQHREITDHVIVWPRQFNQVCQSEHVVVSERDRAESSRIQITSIIQHDDLNAGHDILFPTMG